mmetsp:Transcript_53443/g.87953  ORF Transcript_53443/g.87953 Transcript_53443/m.87953 type:complete len:94 (-) Transcript_53443:385-666(-)
MYQPAQHPLQNKPKLLLILSEVRHALKPKALVGDVHWMSGLLFSPTMQQNGGAHGLTSGKAPFCNGEGPLYCGAVQELGLPVHPCKRTEAAQQ